MAENIIPPDANDPPDPNYDGEAAYTELICARLPRQFLQGDFRNFVLRRFQCEQLCSKETPDT